MSQVRIHGDPFGEDAAASRLRSFVRLAVGSGVECALSLSAVRPRAVAPGETPIPLHDGVRDLQIGTRLPPAEIELLLRSASNAVAATAPVVAFAPPAGLADAVRVAGLEWPEASAVLPATTAQSTIELLGRVRAELRWAGAEDPPHALPAVELAPWLALPSLRPGSAANGWLVHFGSTDPAHGTDLVLELWREWSGAAVRGLRIVVAPGENLGSADFAATMRSSGRVEIVRAVPAPEHLADAAAVLLPWRRPCAMSTLVRALASGRPVCAARFAATAALLPNGVAAPIGGAVDGAGRFEPSLDGARAALEVALGPDGAAIAERARRHVRSRLLTGVPAPAPSVPAAPRAALRPRIVLEAPFFENSSSAELSLATARSLHRRGNVDLALVPRVPFANGLEQLRERAPELEPLLARQPGRADLWLSAGWPVRADRPDCRAFALRVDWEYGALPVELTPHVTQDADHVVVHSEHVRSVVAAAGRPPAGIEVVPHGVDEAMRAEAPPDPDIVRWKAGRPAVLFCGGMVWRKGFDVFLRTVLAAHAAGREIVVVVKAVGHDRHYGRNNLRALLERVVRTPGTPPVLVVERELTRSQLASLYRACDVMLHPYRGEGFCLPVLEARAVGLPVLATAGGATEAFLNGPGATRIPSTRRAIELPGAHVGQPWVLEPDADAAVRLLMAALADLPALAVSARRAVAAVRSTFSWDAAAARLEALAQRTVGGDVAAAVAVPLPLPPARPSPDQLPAVRKPAKTSVR